MKKKYNEYRGYSGVTQMGPKRTSFSSSNYRLTQEQKNMLEIYESQFSNSEKSIEKIGMQNNK